MSKTQKTYELANLELNAAQEAFTTEDSTNHATIACALYLRAITEMLGVKFKEPNQKKGK